METIHVFVCSDHEFIEQQETRLLAVCQRTMALPIARSALFVRCDSRSCMKLPFYLMAPLIVCFFPGVCSASQVLSLSPLPLSPYQHSTLAEGLHLGKDIPLLT